MRWYTYNTQDYPLGFKTYADAVSDAQSMCGTERRPKRIEHGLYYLAGERGNTCYIGQKKHFIATGWEWAASKME